MAVQIETARDRAWRAARWIGWDDPELAKRVARIDTETARWQARLDKAIAALEKAKPRRIYPNELPRRVDVAIRSHSLVCGDALGDRRAGKPTAPEHCAVELEIENTGDRPMTLETGSHRVAFELGELRWLRRAHDAVPAEIMDAIAIDLRPLPAGGSAKQLELAQGQRARVLVAGAREDLELATADHATLLTGRITFGDPFVLRMP